MRLSEEADSMESMNHFMTISRALVQIAITGFVLRPCSSLSQMSSGARINGQVASVIRNVEALLSL